MTDPKIAALESELVATRAQLAATVDELSTRLDPRRQASEAVDNGRRLVRDAVGSDPQADPEARKRARIILGAAGAVVGLIVAGAIRRH
ncbi:DUF3618 domain-containing protein [Cellulomonas chengniuliangii]|uniref:DUF3618 domain-containing protein n=1 Tax=Cellulomonas chengniuliangii TaxID=2968084 RepID=A0ABY5KYN1_9CELL|nr:DUF3618 domain-containing protein [Cellulomonas chengniuliangii]MCC2307615.1 DUF3618 domain-containing protein [Cellulomonas chengniuliangii]UUI75617.1 DUF3618 domain-containing protein [Cellulomonas chengniuliangii]